MNTNTIAVFESKNGYRTCLNANTLGGLYVEHPDYHGLFEWGGTDAFTSIRAGILQDLTKDGTLTVKMSPGRLYHCWHVCFCEKCARVGGKVYTHSQGAWDSHLRFVDNDLVFTFPTATGA